MRVALVSQEYPPETAKGGMGTQTFLKAHGLARLGHDMHVISRSPDGVRSERMDGLVRVTRIGGLDARTKVYTEAADWLSYSVEVAAALAALHQEKPYDLVEFSEWGAEGYIHLLNRTEWNHVPTVLQLHGPLVMMAKTMNWPEEDSELFRVGTMMEGACVRLADRVYSSSRCSVEWCARHYGLDAATTPVIHTGVNTRRFSPDAAPKAERPTIVFVGRLVRNKGVLPLVDAVIEVARDFPLVRLRMVGRGEERVVEDVRERLAAAGLSHALELRGFVSREHLAAEIASAHIFAAPSVYEGGPGLVYLEAMACGLPVIGCVGSGSAEVLEHESNALLVPPDDVVALAASLRRLLGDEILRNRLGLAARRYALEEADSELNLKRLEAFFCSALAGGARKTA